MPPNFHLIGPFLHLALLPKEYVCVECGCSLLKSQKKEASMVERKVCFISDVGNLGRGWQTSVQRPTPHPDKQGVRAFLDRVRGGGYMQKQLSHL